MSRWSQYDEDSYRLPEGMKRIGYDSDTGRYLFRDQTGSIWQGGEGAEFGEMTRVSHGRRPEPDEQEVQTSLRADGYQPIATGDSEPLAFRHQMNASAYRTLAPFFLIIGVSLLLIWKFIFSYGWSEPQSPCPGNATTPYMVQPGEYCWEIAHTHNCTLDELELLNPDVNCDSLLPGTVVCLPLVVPAPSPSQSL